MTSIVNTVRNPFSGQPVGTEIWVALAWCLGILELGYALSVMVYRRCAG
ncbi:hypothetical protein [Citricoccus alkalitolerans]|uniref:Uncharacterized protein n=1 Tax=Citricoccus alkalitolerans TaxID=246603 RepID=A0ABV8XUS7_9MICC